MQKSNPDSKKAMANLLSMPPLGPGERFEDVYEVILILDQREKFAVQGSVDLGDTWFIVLNLFLTETS